ncbi:GNAT family N-acetyltransferase [Spartinivicinus ruber]|uniref:GNAT family N-acetyltransferase n=1 Tax=Spartinivicinus ruber TaxID=2683272 RepID=UPI0013D5F241|nr:GNAT family N-acetyltransferase [Spartinivicinus ruber]
MVTLRPMKQYEFTIFFENEVKEFAEWMTKAYKLPPKRALDIAKEQLSYKYKDGINTKNQYIYTIEDKHQQKIGVVSYSIQKDEQSAWLDTIEIDQPHRQQGYGKQVLALIESKIKQHHVNHIILHVYKNNKIAQTLYKNSGYQIVSHIMTKQLS